MKLTPQDPPGLRRWLGAPGALLLVLLVAAAVFLGRELLQQLDSLSSAESDNVQWNLSQAEVEHLKLEAAVTQAVQSGGLGEVRRRFDVFYSRMATMNESRLYAGLKTDPEAGALLAAVTGRMNGYIPLIDGPDELLQDALPDIAEGLSLQGGEVRRMALVWIRHDARASEDRRRELSLILIRLGWVVVFLVGMLGAGTLVLWFLYRRGRRLSLATAEAAARMEAMVASSLDAILVVDTQGRVQGFNGAAESIFGYTEKEVLGQPMAELIMPEHLREAHKAGMKRFLATGEARVAGKGRVQLEALHKSGRVFPVELSITPARSGKDMVLVSFLRDITDRLEAEAELKRARDDALAVEKAKANLLTVMSHEMRTPLNGVLGSIGLLRDSGVTPAQQRYLEAMRVSGDLLLSHVNDVLELSRLEAGAEDAAREVFDLRALVTGLADSQLASAAGRGNQLDVHCALGASDFVTGDPKQVQRVLLNLIGNALKFTCDGAVSVAATRQEGGLVEFTVADTGAAIPEEDLERIFEDFITLDASYARQSEGTGLGLAISKRMVKSMGGEIGAQSEEGEGSLFWFTLPLPMAEPEVTAGRPEPRSDDGHARILMVEDNDINRLLLETMLHKQGHAVTAAPGGAEGVEAAAAGACDLILMDISMPQVDGIEALRRIRKRGLAPATPAVALTAHAAAEDHARILEAGFAEVLTKPVSQQDLAAVIARQTGSGHLHLAPPTPLPPSLAEVFNCLGVQRAQAHLSKFSHDLKCLRSDVQGGEAPGEALRQEAHRLAGSAAILGFEDLRTCLASLEHAGDGPWDPSGLDAAWDEVQTVIEQTLAR